jgi:hypothetical protein
MSPAGKVEKSTSHISTNPSISTIPKAFGFEAATLRVAGVSPARHAGILPAVSGLAPIVVIRMGTVLLVLCYFAYVIRTLEEAVAADA